MSTVIVTGSRVWKDQTALWAALDVRHRQEPITLVVHGGAKGADTMAGLWAQSRGVEERIYRADWEQHGKSAGMRRNVQMLLEHPEAQVIGCPLPGGKGTQVMMMAALKRQMRVQVVSPEGLR